MPVRVQDVGRHSPEEYGGVKVGSAFFGWLTATGTAVLLTALVAAAGTAVGLATDTDVGWLINEKGAVAATAVLPGVPADFSGRAHAILAHLGTRLGELGAAIDAAADLLGDTRAACHTSP